MSRSLCYGVAVLVSMGLFSIGFANLGLADYTLNATGNNASGGYDNSWSAAYLGNFEIGIGEAYHNGTQLGGTFQNGGTDSTGTVRYNAGDQFDLGVLQGAYDAATLTKAFVYDNSQWPLGNNSNAWANLTNTYEGTNWVGSADGFDDSGDLLTHSPGYYAFETTFFADQFYSTLTGSIATDNALLGVMVNGQFLDLVDFFGQEVGGGTDYDISQQFAIDGSWFNYDDYNTITFIVNNYGNADNRGNPTGLWIGELTGVAATPEPATWLMMGIAGLVGIPAYCRMSRNRKKSRSDLES